MAKGNGTMNDYKVVPVEPTAEMLAAGGIEMGARDEDARTVWMAMLAAAPAVQGEPVAWQVINIKYPKVEPATHNRYPDWAEGDQDLKINPLYTAPQPAEQQPDVAQLVEALEAIQKVATRRGTRTGIQAGTALGCIAAICDVTLAAHRKGGEK